MGRDRRPGNESEGGRGEQDVPIRGSVPGPLLRFAIRVVEEKEAVGVLCSCCCCCCCRHCHCDVRCQIFDDWVVEGIFDGLNTGRKAERFMVGCGEAQWRVGDRVDGGRVVWMVFLEIPTCWMQDPCCAKMRLVRRRGTLRCEALYETKFLRRR